MTTMNLRPLPDQDFLLKLFRYDPETGDLYYRENSDKPAQWNKKWANKIAGKKNHRYAFTKINQVEYMNHRLIWKMMTGNDPVRLLDHKDQNPHNNRIENLREADDVQNQYNTKLLSSNHSGHRGVSWNKRYKVWKVAIRLPDKRVHLGCFKDFDAACKAYDEIAIELHGEFHPTQDHCKAEIKR